MMRRNNKNDPIIIELLIRTNLLVKLAIKKQIQKMLQPRIELGPKRWQRSILPLNYYSYLNSYLLSFLNIQFSNLDIQLKTFSQSICLKSNMPKLSKFNLQNLSKIFINYQNLSKSQQSAFIRMDPNKKGKRPPPLPSFGNSKLQPPNKDEDMQKKLDSFFTEIQKQSIAIKQTNINAKQIEIKTVQNQQKLSASAPITNTVADKKKLSLASINSKLNTMLTSKKINLNIGASKSADSTKPNVPNPQKVQKKRSEISTQYDPSFPNNFDLSINYYAEKFAELQNQDVQMQNENKKIINNTGIGLQRMAEQADIQKQGPSIQQEQHALDQRQQIALRMMQKFGYKVGKGLGKLSQGITTPLTIKKTTDTSCVIEQSSINMNQFIKPQISAKNALLANRVAITEVIVFINLIKIGQITQQVQKQLKQECKTYGLVKNWLVYLLKDNQGKEQLRIFIQFQNKQAAFNAFLKLNNRFYNQSLASIRFYSKQQFQGYKLNLPIHQHIQT